MHISDAAIIFIASCPFVSAWSWSLNNITGYAPFIAQCPQDGNIVRNAVGISPGEALFLANRKPKASMALKIWLGGLKAGFDTRYIPTIALTSSGGGFRACLAGAGVVKGFDGREKTNSSAVSGLYQAFTYHAGLSGGSWLLSSLASHNFPLVTELKDSLWKKTFANSYFFPDSGSDWKHYKTAHKSIESKEDAGFDNTLTDVWGTLLAYQLLPDGGATTTLSGLTALSSIQKGEAPYPIITSLGVLTSKGQCLPKANATQYEFHPYEMGSWDRGVHSFNGSLLPQLPIPNGTLFTRCYNGYDNLGYVLGTSSHLFNEYCYPFARQESLAGRLLDLLPKFQKILHPLHQKNTHDFYATYPNPFFNLSTAPLVAADRELMLVDGGESNQNNPIWPLIQTARDVDVVIVNDNSADTNHLPDGTAIRQTYVEALAAGLHKMPYIPPQLEFISRNLTSHALAFGCSEPNTVTMIYLPNAQFSYPSGMATTLMQYKPNQTDGMIANGAQVASQNGDPEWPVCLGCILMKKTRGRLPAVCGKCFEKYCYKQAN
ncbi:lysophospholipase [Rhizodiscina lignyota]|uniref:Lysophospholipase n=1 Tax=Rhizodiscina lignyota TaxID=1504668 RepID=A0A9P4I9Q0_9PEZI|nr:lysophospholipase [Rhizodiscina lignyota]